MPAGLQTFQPDGTIIFDSTTANILFLIDEQLIDKNGVSSSGRQFSYPNSIGRKISASLICLDADFSYGPGGVLVPSCRVDYVGGTPVVYVFYDNFNATIPKANGYLLVFDTGAPQ
jgi:hypothetical protein